MATIPNKTSKALVILALIGLISCVTINIYFPAEEVKKAAQEIVGDIRPEAGPPPPQESSPPKQKDGLRFRELLWPAASKAYAQNPTSISNQAINNLKARLKARQPQLAPFFSRGVIGENNQGYIQILNVQGLSLKDRAQLQRLVDADRSDRSQLYQQVARALNVEQSQEARIGAIFAPQWQNTARGGWFIQQPNGQWVKK